MSASTSPSQTPLRVAVAGAGRRGLAHARAAVACGATVEWVFDPDPERAVALAAETGARVVERYDSLMDAEPDVLLVTSPPAVHAAQTVAALEAGAHVILEKPIALSMAVAATIGRAAERAGRRVHVCQQHRYTLAADRARDALAGRKVALVHVWLYRQAPDIRANWRREWGGGHVVEWAIHPLDFCRFVVGDVAQVFAAYADQVLAGTDGWDNWDAYACTLRFANGAVGSVATTYAAWPGAGGGFALDIVAEGVIVRWRSGRLEIERPGAKTTWTEPHEPTVNLHRAFYASLVSGDETGIRLPYPEAVKTLATVLACNRSHETGRPVRVAELLEEAGS